jgi:hypothetical protein
MSHISSQSKNKASKETQHAPPKRRITFNGLHGVVSPEDRTLRNNCWENRKSCKRHEEYRWTSVGNAFSRSQDPTVGYCPQTFRL